ncbi:MAG: S24/S26 family peptidase [Oscillospiraceae bacterium]|nr:S24/S26 family peptidase [Oscillospiraceae bacterium]MBQ7000299.1 S24/S26 family peptidase [Oscillospiraceae bacterium]
MELSAVSMESIVPLIRLQLENGGRSHLIVTGVSMHPTLRNCRDRVELIPPPQRYCRGDLILYQRLNGRYILHRIVKVNADGSFICSGDNQWQPERVEAHQVIALVDTYIRNGKRIRANAPACKAYVWLWVRLFPVRKPILKLRRCFGRLRKKKK